MTKEQDSQTAADKQNNGAEYTKLLRYKSEAKTTYDAAVKTWGAAIEELKRKPPGTSKK